MIIVPVKEGEPSVLKRLKMEHAVYVQKLRQSEEA